MKATLAFNGLKLNTCSGNSFNSVVQTDWIFSNDIGIEFRAERRNLVRSDDTRILLDDEVTRLK